MIRPTVFIESKRLNDALGATVILATETFQHTGSFKFRAAYNVVSKVPNKHLITVSSGNFAQALAFACSLFGKRCTVIMPASSAQVKIDAVRSYGAEVRLIDTAKTTRQEALNQLSAEFSDAYVASPYDDDFVIEGNATLGDELSKVSDRFDGVIVPIGGGGLSAGIIIGLQRNRKKISVYGAEPIMANDAARSLKAGKIVSNESEPQTIADGTRTLSIGMRNWAILEHGLKDIIEVSEKQIKEGVRLLFQLANLKAEPTGALSIGALLAAQDAFRNRPICCIVSGGNVDPGVYAKLVT